ncbi:MAG: glycosyltransferase family 4 protein [Planctomycetes bacterium]|nr:glycosyltransferase family 4 protein [Planctomycetota bacterium]
MRILMMWSENLNKHGSGRTHFLYLARELAALGHDVRLVAPGYRPRAGGDLGVPVHYIPVPRRSLFSFLLFHLLLVLAMPYLLLRYRPDVVYTRGLFHSFLIHVVCRLGRTPYVAEIDSIVDAELAMRRKSLAAWLVRVLDRWNLRWATAFVCVTEGLRNEVVRRGAKADRVVAIHNGAAVDCFSPGDPLEARRQLGLPEDAALVGFVGTLAAWQGLDLLVDAAAALPDDGTRWQVILVGDGEMRDQLAQQARERGVAERVTFVPGVPHDRVPAYVQALDVVVVPIHDDRKLRYGLSVLKFWEALASAVPVLVPDRGGLGNVLADLDWPGEYRTGDAEALAQTVARTIARKVELQSRREAIHQKVCRDHSWAAVARRTDALFRRLTDGLCAREVGETESR